MRKKIQDEFTNLPISSTAKWERRHPERHAMKQRVWRLHNPDAANAIAAKSRRKNLLQRIELRKEVALGWRGMKERNLKGEILRLLARGKSVVDLAIVYRIPVSAIAKLKESLGPKPPSV